VRRILSAREGVRADIVVGDLGDRALARGLVRDVGTVFHLAAGTRGRAADLFLNTVVGSRNLLEGLRGGSVSRVILISSFSVYGTAGLKPGTIIDENTPLEDHPEKRDLYSYSKWRQERLFWEYRERHGVPLVVMRPGVIYGPGGTALSTRVGINVGGLFLHLGRRNLLPLTYVDNCAEAAVIAGSSDRAAAEVYNVVDDDLPTSGEYLRAYRKQVQPIRYVTLPYWCTMTISRAIERYSRASKGQLPAVLTPYKTASHWKPLGFSNSKLKGIGWAPIVRTRDGMARTFAHCRTAASGRR
jgi:nucleoside-diphosphate-sugar epimerase